MEDIRIIILCSIFIILLIVIYDTAKSAFDMEGGICLVISVSATLLAMIGINELLSGSMEVLLLPYTAMGISIIAVILIAFISKHAASIKRWYSRRSDRKETRNMHHNNNIKTKG